jgi:hypothetical protein
MRLAAFALLRAVTPAAAADKDGWTDLLKSGPDSPWQKVDPNWVLAGEVGLDPDQPKRLKAKPADGGPIWTNGKTGRLPDLITKEKFGDCEVHVEFLIATGSNSGIKFHAVYEIQALSPFPRLGPARAAGRQNGERVPAADPTVNNLRGEICKIGSPRRDSCGQPYPLARRSTGQPGPGHRAAARCER